MKIRIIAVGTRMPSWVYDACDEYLKRFPRELEVSFQELSLANRSAKANKSNTEMFKRQESEKLIAAVPSGYAVVALDVLGKQESTEQLAKRLKNWQMQGQHIAILIGGPDGITSECLNKANERISLSKLTLPHPVVRVVLVEQLYRAYTINAGHPYHK